MKVRRQEETAAACVAPPMFPVKQQKVKTGKDEILTFTPRRLELNDQLSGVANKTSTRRKGTRSALRAQVDRRKTERERKSLRCEESGGSRLHC